MMYAGEGRTIPRRDPIKSLQKAIRKLNAKIKHPEKMVREWTRERDDLKAALKLWRGRKKEAQHLAALREAAERI
jgi:hypothetical protein